MYNLVAQFVSSDEVYNYCKNLPVIDKGIDISNYGINTDFIQNSRIINGISDIGAFEYPDSTMQRQNSKSIKVFSKDLSGKLNINSEKKERIKKVSIYELSGQLIYTSTTGNEEITVTSNNKLSKGIYLVCVATENEEYRSKINICLQN